MKVRWADIVWARMVNSPCPLNGSCHCLKIGVFEFEVRPRRQVQSRHGCWSQESHQSSSTRCRCVFVKFVPQVGMRHQVSGEGYCQHPPSRSVVGSNE